MTTSPKYKILLVDDDSELLRLLSIRLTGASYDVTAVDSAEKALASLSHSRPNLVITDLRMQGMDGMALFAAIHQNNPACGGEVEGGTLVLGLWTWIFVFGLWTLVFGLWTLDIDLTFYLKSTAGAFFDVA